MEVLNEAYKAVKPSLGFVLYETVFSRKLMADDMTKRLGIKKQTLEDAYSPPANFLEIDVTDPLTHGVAKTQYTDYEVHMRVSLTDVYQSSFDCIEWKCNNCKLKCV